MQTRDYLTALAFEPLEGRSSPPETVRLCYCLVVAREPEEALSESRNLGKRLNAVFLPTFSFTGVHELLLIHEPLQSGTEIIWTELELTPDEQRALEKVHPQAAESPSGWYFGRVVLSELHDEGEHQGKVLTWINGYIVEAPNATAAQNELTSIGRAQQTEPGSHTCDGQKAHWVFVSVRDVTPLSTPPVGGALLWCEDVPRHSLHPVVPDKEHLGVFIWQRQQKTTR